MNTWDTIKASLEPVSEKFYTNIETAIQLSQAISLKRIANALEKLTVVPTMTELSPEQQKEFEKELLKHPSMGDIIFNKS